MIETFSPIASPMTLTAGATLQSSKYVIQTRLHQSDFGATYEAMHTLLDQPVILQTLNPVVQQRPDFAELRRQFMEAVRSLSQREAAQGTARVLDCFEEAEMPFVVLQKPIAGQDLPKLNDWLVLSPDPIVKEPAESAIETPAETPAEISEAASEALPVVLAPEVAAPAPEVAAPAAAQTQTPQTQTSQATVSVAPKAPKAPKQVLPLLPELPAKASYSVPEPAELAPKRRLPVALLITALAGLGLGAGGGLALRYQPSRYQSTPQNSANQSQSAPSFFDHEQTFPTQNDWPIQEDPTLFHASPKLEQPVYRSTPVPDYYTAPTQPLYSAPQPAAPPAYDPKPIPDLSLDETPTPANPEPKQPNLDPPAPRKAAIDSAPVPAPPASQSEPAPIPRLSPLVPIAPEPAPPISAPPAQAPKGLGTPPLVSQ